MEFRTHNALKKATGRAKSDVANKLVSMLLHEISRKACSAAHCSVSDREYREAVVNAFGDNCLYCGTALETHRAAVEHLNGMNRFRIGLHIPGNVALACTDCNREKRRDDQASHLTLATTGWESFLSHDGTQCQGNCKTCTYWLRRWGDKEERTQRLKEAMDRIRAFQMPFLPFIEWSSMTRPAIQDKVEALYRACQEFATMEIEKLTSELGFDFEALRPRPVEIGPKPVKNRTGTEESLGQPPPKLSVALSDAGHAPQPHRGEGQ
ncbi:MAG TPA: hypothetical protein VG796_08765 [Verrucomicrobiales bacterium]|nr:hypothetical protein [Verrucomicrobiales bacterium]